MRLSFVTIAIIAALLLPSCAAIDTEPLHRPAESGFSETFGLSAAAFSPDGQYSKESLPGLSGPVLALEFSQDGSKLAAGGAHPGVPIWDLISLSEIGALPAEEGVFDLDLIPGTQSLLVAGKDLRLWEFQSAAEAKALDNPSLAGDYITIGTMTATFVVLTAFVGGAAAIGGEEPPMVDFPVSWLMKPAHNLCKRVTAVSPGGDYIVDVHPGKLKEKIRIVDAREDSVLKRLNPRGGNTCGAAFSPDGSKLLIVNNRVARLYDVSSWQFRDFVLD